MGLKRENPEVIPINTYRKARSAKKDYTATIMVDPGQGTEWEVSWTRSSETSKSSKGWLTDENIEMKIASSGQVRLESILHVCHQGKTN